jgi:hypothetical protein
VEDNDYSNITEDSFQRTLKSDIQINIINPGDE